MNGRAFSAIFMLLVLLVAGLVSTPALSGEHPWDSDLTGGEDPCIADYDWDTRAADSAQIDNDSENVNSGDSSGTSSPDVSLTSFVIGFFSALNIGF